MNASRRIAIAALGLVTAASSVLVTSNASADRVNERDNSSSPHHQPSYYPYSPVPYHYRPAPRQGVVTVVVPRYRYYRGVRVIRPYGRAYYGYGYFYTDNDAYKYLAFTAIALKLLDNLNEEQQRTHEAAQVRAISANVGETIVWQDAGASGAVTTTRIGTSRSGLQCREFQQTVTIGGRTEQAYGTACLQPDGSWEVMN